MIKFTISFMYQNMPQRAGVLRSETGRSTEYNVRPVDPSIVRKFGKQISIFKQDECYNTHNHIDKDYADFFNSLVNAIQHQDIVEYE